MIGDDPGTGAISAYLKDCHWLHASAASVADKSNMMVTMAASITRHTSGRDRKGARDWPAQATLKNQLAEATIAPNMKMTFVDP